jgi:hypothetical protein
MLVECRATKMDAPTGVNFSQHFRLIDQNTRNHILRHNVNFPPSLFLYSGNKQTVNIYRLVHTDIPLSGQNAIELFFQTIEETPHDYYVIVLQALGKKPRENYQHGDVGNLLNEMKTEQLIVDGQSQDGSQARTMIYEIIRNIKGDDSSRVLRFERFTNTEEDCQSISRPELNRLRRQTFRSVLSNQYNRPWIISNDSRTQLPLLDDIGEYLHPRKLSPKFVSFILHSIKDKIRSCSNTDPTTRIVDHDGNTISFDKPVEKYYRKTNLEGFS